MPAFKGYRGFPATLCTSVNAEVVHGIPSPKRVLKDGDIVSIDIGVKLDGFFGDSAVTVPVGKVPDRTKDLLTVTRESLERGISQVKVGGRRVGYRARGAGVGGSPRVFGGARVRRARDWRAACTRSRRFRTSGRRAAAPKLAEGMVLAIEPMVAMGRPEVRVLGDGWTAVTKDGSLAAHFEHTVAVGADGPLILTARTSAAGVAAGAR